LGGKLVNSIVSAKRETGKMKSVIFMVHANVGQRWSAWPYAQIMESCREKKGREGA